MRASDLEKLIEWCILNQKNLMIKGRPGIGKTQITEQVISRLQSNYNIAYYLWHPVVHDPTNYKGLPFPSDNKEFTKWLPYGGLYDLSKSKADINVIVADDFGQSSESVQKPFMQLMWGGKIDGFEIPKNTVFILLTNRREDKAGVGGILEPVKSRCTGGIVQLDFNLDDWIKWAIKDKQPVANIAFAKFKPSIFSTYKPTKDLTNSFSPRLYAEVGDAIRRELPKELEFETFSGMIGEAETTEFLAFLDMYRSLPDPELIIKSPMTADVPKKPDVLYAICGALSHKSKEDNIDNIMKYCGRLPEEFQVLMVQNIIEYNKDMINTKAFVSWAAKHSNVIIKS